MARDYAKRQTRKKRAKKKSNIKLWLITLALLALFIFILAHLGSNHKKARHIVKKKITVVKKTTATQKPQFDFYTILPKEKINLNKLAAANKPTKQYYLQVAAVKKYIEADRLKAQLSLLGFDVYIDKVTENGVVWNRINVGPYFSEKEALADQKRLGKNDISSQLHSEKIK